MTWLFFLKIYDAKEEEWEFHDDSYESIIPDRLRWHSWAPVSYTHLDVYKRQVFEYLNSPSTVAPVSFATCGGFAKSRSGDKTFAQQYAGTTDELREIVDVYKRQG